MSSPAPAENNKNVQCPVSTDQTQLNICFKEERASWDWMLICGSLLFFGNNLQKIGKHRVEKVLNKKESFAVKCFLKQTRSYCNPFAVY